MRHIAVTSIVAVAVLSVSAGAQKTTLIHRGQGGSPHMRTEWTIHGANISIEYGRPYLNGRRIGRAVAPYRREWRTGADEATTIRTDKPLMFGKVSVPAGVYTLYTIPNENEWTLAISRNTGQWGIPVQMDKDVGRVPMTVGATKAPVEQLTIAIDETPTGGTLRIEWGTISASTPFASADPERRD
jgi:hypothetical protein